MSCEGRAIFLLLACSMLHLSRRRWATWLLSAAYLLANVASGLWHDHAHAPTGGVACAHADDGHLDCTADDHDHPSEELAGDHLSARTAGSSHDDDCTVCRAAGQRVLTAQNARLDALHHFCVELTLISSDRPFAAVMRTCRSRAPPLAG